MGNNINLSKNLIRLTIDDDESRVFSFNPNDTRLYERLIAFIADLEAAQQDFERKAAALENTQALGNGAEQVALVTEFCNVMESGIDHVFGEGTSNLVFNGVRDLEQYPFFIEALIPYFEKARQQRTNKYAKKTTGGVM